MHPPYPPPVNDYLKLKMDGFCSNCSREALPFWDVTSLDSSVNTTYSRSATDSAVSDTSSTNPAANSVSVAISPSAPSLTIFIFNASICSQNYMSLEPCSSTIPITSLVSQKPGSRLTFWITNSTYLGTPSPSEIAAIMVEELPSTFQIVFHLHPPDTEICT